MATINKNFKDYMRIEHFSPNSVETYTRNINQCLDYIGKPETEINAIDIMDWKESLDGYSSATIAQHISSVKSYFDFLTDYDIIAKNPTTKLKAPNIVNKEKHHMTIDQIRDMIKACRSSRDRAIVILAASSGMRVSEFTGLTVSQYKNMRANNSHKIRIVGKGNKAGDVIINEESCRAIDDYLKTRDDCGTGCDKLFLSAQGNQIARNHLNETLKSTARRAGISWWKDMSNHQLRSACATINSDRNVPVAQIRDIMRHSSITTTNRYINGDEDIVEANVMDISFM